MSSLIRIQNLKKIYVKGSVRVEALRSVSLTVESGAFVSIVGRSGSGKSTLLNLVGGLDTATSGDIHILQNDLTRMSSSALAHHRRFTVGMVFQSFNLIPSRTALDNVVLALAFGGVPRRQRKSRAADLLNTVGLSGRLDHTPGELSGGEAQRVAIARALANRPKILLADEPTGNLDSRTSVEIIDLLRKLNEEGLTVLMVTHDEGSAEAVSDRVVHFLDGQIIDGRNPGSGDAD